MYGQPGLYSRATRRQSSAPGMKAISIFGEGAKMEISLILLQDLSILTIPAILRES
jgi:hypothetical protein